MSRPLVMLDHDHANQDGYHHYHYSLEDRDRGILLYITAEVLTRESMEEMLADPDFVGVTRVYQTDPETGALSFGPLLGSDANRASADLAMSEFTDHYEEAASAL